MKLKLHKISLKDAPFVQKYAADKLIADTTASIPHPYPNNGGRNFVKEAIQKRKDKKAFIYVIDNKQFIGVCSLFGVNWEKLEAEVGYWIGVPFWGKGYATEAVSLLIPEARKLGLKSLVGKCLKRNPASKRVMEKNGFVFTKESVGCGRHTHDKVLEYELRLSFSH